MNEIKNYAIMECGVQTICTIIVYTIIIYTLQGKMLKTFSFTWLSCLVWCQLDALAESPSQFIQNLDNHAWTTFGVDLAHLLVCLPRESLVGGARETALFDKNLQRRGEKTCNYAWLSAGLGELFETNACSDVALRVEEIFYQKRPV